MQFARRRWPCRSRCRGKKSGKCIGRRENSRRSLEHVLKGPCEGHEHALEVDGVKAEGEFEDVVLGDDDAVL